MKRHILVSIFIATFLVLMMPLRSVAITIATSSYFGEIMIDQSAVDVELDGDDVKIYIGYLEAMIQNPVEFDAFAVVYDSDKDGHITDKDTDLFSEYCFHYISEDKLVCDFGNIVFSPDTLIKFYLKYHNECTGIDYDEYEDGECVEYKKKKVCEGGPFPLLEVCTSQSYCASIALDTESMSETFCKNGSITHQDSEGIILSDYIELPDLTPAEEISEEATEEAAEEKKLPFAFNKAMPNLHKTKIWEMGAKSSINPNFFELLYQIFNDEDQEEEIDEDEVEIEIEEESVDDEEVGWGESGQDDLIAGKVEIRLSDPSESREDGGSSSGCSLNAERKEKGSLFVLLLGIIFIIILVRIGKKIRN